MTVGELLEMPALSELELVAGKAGLHRIISTVTVIDAPDGLSWSRGGEFVITSGFAVKDGAHLLMSMVQQLVACKASGLGIKRERYIKSIPPEVLEFAEQQCFPIVFIPNRYAFSDIINPVLSLIVNRQSALLMQSSKIHKTFQELAVNSNNVLEILKTLGSLLDCSVAFVDIHFRNCYYSNPESALAKQIMGLKFEDLAQKVFPQYSYYVVKNKSQNFGYLLMDSLGTSEMDKEVVQTAIEYAAVVLILRMQTRISNQQIEEKYRDSFMEDLLLNNVKTEEEIHNRAQLYGWNFQSGGIVAVIDINNIKKCYLKSLDTQTNQRLEGFTQSIYSVSIQCMLDAFPDAKYCKQSDTVAFIISARESDKDAVYSRLEEIFNEIRQTLANRVSFTITMGVGEYVENIRDIHTSYAQARTAINLGYQLEAFDCALFYSRLGVYRLLATTAHSPESEDCFNRYIRPLMDYDSKNHTNLLDTLQAVIKHGWNLKDASGTLFVHYNTVKYRYSKIRELLDLDLREHEIQLAVEIALKMYMINTHRWE
ncbi:PucR family transcriptional regulator ligand-binding domain-containing protein [Oscillibacter sp.]|uniref:PucR family transcriptional regulator n=1 Tax=Oscillibacter sp. TaxID=1945593 RepID=UPI0028A21C2A|nr:PucR family transcriptional regulator ligand-binding domain-containing protein [Oscillibacter sp.]